MVAGVDVNKSTSGWLSSWWNVNFFCHTSPLNQMAFYVVTIDTWNTAPFSLELPLGEQCAGSTCEWEIRRLEKWPFSFVCCFLLTYVQCARLCSLHIESGLAGWNMAPPQHNGPAAPAIRLLQNELFVFPAWIFLPFQPCTNLKNLAKKHWPGLKIES